MAPAPRTARSAAGQPMPTSYGETITYDRKVDDVRMALAGGNVTDYAVEPPLPPAPDRIPVTDADRRGVFDPMTSMLNRVAGTGDPVSPEACNRKVPVFDGRVRYDLRSEYKRMETVKADRGYAGPVAVCAVYFTADFRLCAEPSRDQISGHAARRRSLAGADRRHARLVPFRFSMPTPLGTGLLQATEFVSVAQPATPGGQKRVIAVWRSAGLAAATQASPVIHRTVALDSA